MSALATAFAWLLAGVLPGLVALWGLRPAAGWLRNVTLSPLASYGILMAVAVPLSQLGGPVRASTVLPAAFLLAGALALLGMARRRSDESVRALLIRRVDVLVVAVAVVASAILWLTATQMLQAVPPNDDGSNHGLFATQVVRLATLDPARVVVGDVIAYQPHASYYPLAMHLVAAMMAGIAGTSVALALNVQVLMATCLLPVGMFILTRRLFPARPGAAALAAALSVCFANMPYHIAAWGGYPFIVGLALVPIAVDALIGLCEDCDVIASAALGGVLFVALFALHTSELFTVAALAGVVVVAQVLRRERRLVDVAVAWVIAGVVLLTFLVPQWRQITAGAGAVATAAPLRASSVPTALADILTSLTGVPDPNQLPNMNWIASVVLIIGGIVLWILTIFGAEASVRERWSPEWVVALVGWLLFAVAAALRLPGIDLLTVPWYTRWDRIVYTLPFLVLPLCALGIMTVGERWVHPSRRLLTVGAATAIVAVPAFLLSAAVLAESYRAGSLAGPAQRAAFAWLSDRVQPGERVLNDPSDGSGWMWALNEVPPVFSLGVHQISPWGDRTYLQRNAAEVAEDARATEAADQWRVRYAYVGPRVYAGRKRALTVAELTSKGGWKIVYQRGGATVLERKG